MFCEKCGKNEATVFVSKVIEDSVQEFYICSSCAKERELTAKLGLFNNQNNKKVCSCGTTFEEIGQSGYVSCPECYQTFKDELEPVISSMHNSLIHIGKRPCSKIESLKSQIQKAYENNFISLAKKLEGELKQLEGDYE